jgi:hypothetical protein
VKYIVYTDGTEVFVTTKKDEQQMLRDYFIAGRKPERYERTVIDDSSVLVLPATRAF